MTEDSTMFLSLAVSPRGHLYLYSDKESLERVSKTLFDQINHLFDTSASVGLLRLGIVNLPLELPPSLSFWQQFSRIFVAEICKLSGFETISNDELSKLSSSIPCGKFDDLLKTLPFMRGAEYINLKMMTLLWQDLVLILPKELSHFEGKLQDYFASFNSNWNRVGRVCFHLAENKTNPDYPFAFLATITTKMTGNAKLKHLPLSEVLKEYSQQRKNAQLLSLLLPVQKASSQSPFIKNLVDTGEIFEAKAWKISDAHQFLKDVPVIEEAGVVVHVPNWWNPKKPPRPQITIAVGNVSTGVAGLGALLDFDMHFVMPDGSNINLEELEDLINSDARLVQIKGSWVEIDSNKLKQVLSHWKKVERQVKREGLSFSEGMRMLAGAERSIAENVTNAEVAQWSKVIEGPWLQDVLERLRSPQQDGDHQLLEVMQQYLHAGLRPYQQIGVKWLFWLYNFNLGGCLADDMGLGKTIQVLALLLLAKHQRHSSGVDVSQLPSASSLPNPPNPHLLVLPASLLGNWQLEINKFAPTLKVLVVHSSEALKQTSDLPYLSNIDLVITTYTYVARLDWLRQVSWDIIILDEAQNIKNPAAKQTQSVKSLSGRTRFILTGTPIENRLQDLWSLFDFCLPNLLGTSKGFSNYGKKATIGNLLNGAQGTDNNSSTTHNIQQFYTTVRNLVSPYILRRLKSDKQIIDDLPDKTEIDAYCNLSTEQIVLYQQSINELKSSLDQGLEAIARSGLVLSYLTRFKQICNHPSQWLGHGKYNPDDSGKFMRLKELCAVIADKQEKVLIFTQFREIIPHLSEFCENIFKRPGIVLHGQTAIKTRAKLVEEFQTEQGPPFFILSLKAGGTGLNLTNASHVIHFDRWWNPAVENQATDRAYRIGQKNNVLVHKFICRGTIEEKIDFLIKSKQGLSDELLVSGTGAEAITNLSDAELLKILTLDIHLAAGES